MDVIATRNRRGLTNYKVPIPGSDVTAYLGVWDSDPKTWIYSLWSGEGDNEELISHDTITFPERVTPEQVARIVFLLDVEYGRKG